jgi:hypothetical protein
MAIISKNRKMFKLSYYVFDFENKYCCLFLINKGTLLYDQISHLTFKPPAFGNTPQPSAREAILTS